MVTRLQKQAPEPPETLKVLKLYLPFAHLLEAGQQAEQQGGREAEDPGVRHPGGGATELPCQGRRGEERRGGARRGGEGRDRDFSHVSPPMGSRLGVGRSFCTAGGWTRGQAGGGKKRGEVRGGFLVIGK